MQKKSESTFPQTDSELDSYFQDLQAQTLRIIIIAMGIACIILLSLGFEESNNGWIFGTGLGILGVLLASWFLVQNNFSIVAIALIIASTAGIYSVAVCGGIHSAVVLIVLPAGLAMLMLNIWGGLTFAGLASFLILLAPNEFFPIPVELRWACAFEIWTTVGIIWLALRPLLHSVEWTWSAYEESRRLLEQARDAQAQLQQALGDAASANQQLVRLHKLSQDLRQIAENERQIKQQFVANVSHELRTPLNMIIGFCEVILKKPQAYGKRGLPPVLLADLEVVLRNSQHLSELIDDVLDLSQIDAGKMALYKERSSLRDIIEAAVIAIRPLFKSKGLYLETVFGEDLPAIYCDRTRIREVILNLLSNAGRFTSKGGVTLQAKKEKNSVVVVVTDTGTGMSPEVQDKLFEPFQQADGTIYRRFGGTGLGLAISKNFVELHDGKMWVQSQPGTGTSFFFELPIDPPIPLKSGPLRWLNMWPILKERVKVARPLSSEVMPRLVIVEQGDVMQKLLNRYLQDVEIDSTSDLEDALTGLASSPAQALLVNALPIESALTHLLKTDTLPYNTPAIICSVPGIEQASAAFGVKNYLVKPISQETLLTALDQIDQPIHNILLVDDEPDAVQLFRRILITAERDYRVLRASNGLHALEILQDEKIDVILLDLTMPEMDGFEFLARRNLNEKLREVPVILISARDPSGQPIASNAIVLTRGGGLSAGQIMSCIEAFMTILSPAAS